MTLTQITLHTAVLAGAGLWLDIQAQRTPVGLYRVALPFYLALAWQGWWSMSLVLAVLGLFFLPALRQERRSALEGMLYMALGVAAVVALPNHWPVLALVAALGSLGSVAMLIRLPRDLQGRRLRRALLGFQGVWPWTLLLAVDGPLSALIAADLLWALSYGIVNAIHRVY
ncbi:hypothetical protein IV102_09370, partial [bacterium]|nr:hypothetical protein [bacterium]